MTQPFSVENAIMTFATEAKRRISLNFNSICNKTLLWIFFKTIVETNA